MGTVPVSSQLPFRTSLDLELDLQASHTKLSHLNDEIMRLKELLRVLRESKHKGKKQQISHSSGESQNKSSLYFFASEICGEIKKTIQFKRISEFKCRLTFNCLGWRGD